MNESSTHDVQRSDTDRTKDPVFPSSCLLLLLLRDKKESVVIVEPTTGNNIIRKMTDIVVLCLIISLIACNCQNVRPGGGQSKRKPRQKPGKQGGRDDKPFRAVTINYPLKFFDGSDQEWRTEAKYNADLVKRSEKTRAWSELSYAQDQEDVWLYENWFYGMQNGVIMESGALNGILFSTSYMFETFANWTAIHVGA